MSWMQALYETYERNRATVGAELWPLNHGCQQAHIEIAINAAGDFLRATVVAKEETLIPATASSAGRTGAPSPHALCDKLQYVAADCPRRKGKWEASHQSYIRQLSEWCETNPHPKSIAILKYVRKGEVTGDLLRVGVLHADSEGNLLSSWPPKSKPPAIFQILKQQGQSDAFVRWRVETPDETCTATWEDQTLIDSWSAFELSRQSRCGLCMISGKSELPLAENHPKRIRNSGDGAKLISSNDTDGYTFLGRFLDASQSASISLEATEKAHSALRWLIGRQGYKNDSQIIVAWAVSGKPIPDPMANTEELYGEENREAQPQEPVQTTEGDAGQAVGRRLSRMIAGYQSNLGPTDRIVVMCLDSAVPGRLAVTYFRELDGSDYLHRIGKWHEAFAWPQNYSWDLQFVGVPAPKEIAAAAYSWAALSKQGKKHLQSTIERLLPCIIDGRPLPMDLLLSAVRRACNRSAQDRNTWEKTLGIACSLFKGRHQERNYRMALENDRRTRDYLYGRLLAIAERLESRAIHFSDEKRETSAERLMQRFADHPYSTWLNIEKALVPYKARLRSKSPAFLFAMQAKLDEVHDCFRLEDYTNDRALTGEFLLGYHCQRSGLNYKDASPPNAPPQAEDQQSS